VYPGVYHCIAATDVLTSQRELLVRIDEIISVIDMELRWDGASELR
jgi:hypothetical protein